MGNALAQNATDLVTSNGASDWDDTLFDLAVKNAAERSAKGMTRERQMLNRSKLITSVCQQYRAAYSSVYAKGANLPSDVFASVTKAVDKFIMKSMARINYENILSFRAFNYVDFGKMRVTSRSQLTGEDMLTLERQIGAVDVAISLAEAALTKLMTKNALPGTSNPNYEKEKELRIRIQKLYDIKAYIAREMKNQENAVKPTA